MTEKSISFLSWASQKHAAPATRLVIAFVSMLAFPVIGLSQCNPQYEPCGPCDVYCDLLTGISDWNGTQPVGSRDVHCNGIQSTFTLCGGYTATYYVVAGSANPTALGTPHAMQYNGTVYLTYGHHLWSDNKDRLYVGTSSNGKDFSHRLLLDNWQVCPQGSSGCEGAWAPELVVRNGTFILYWTGHHTSQDVLDPRVFVATSTDGGWTWNIPWVWDSQRSRYKGVLDDSYGAYRFGTITTQPGTGKLLMYATSNVDNYVYRFGSFDGFTWTRESSLGFWGFGPSDVKYDAVAGHYRMTLDPPITTWNDCFTPAWKHSSVVISSDGLSFSAPDSEHYILGYFTVSAEASFLADNTGTIQSTTPRLVYMNSEESATYNQGGSRNYLFNMEWKRGSAGYCP